MDWAAHAFDRTHYFDEKFQVVRFGKVKEKAEVTND
jgi:hypothetical protein